MSIGSIWLALIILVPLAGLYFLNVNAALIYLSLCLGYVLYSFDSHNAINSINKHATTLHLKPSSIAINLVLLIGPAVVAFVLQLKSLHGGKKLLNLAPALFCGLFLALVVVPVLPSALASQIIKTVAWAKLTHFQAEIVGIGAFIAIVFFWLTMKSSNKKHSSSRL